MSSSHKRQIVDSLFQENLYHVVRGERKSHPRKHVAHHKRQRAKAKFFVIGVVLLNVVVALGFYSYVQKKQAEDIAFVQREAKAQVALATALGETLPSLFAQGEFLSSYSSGFNLGVKPFNINEINFANEPAMNFARLFGLRVSTIVIDPGHGGKDPGAIADEGAYEKDIVLALALRLRERLLARGGFNVLLTRESDQFVSLQQRVDFANRQKADLFISLHLNSFPNLSKNFIETYYFGKSDDEMVTRLAALENAASDYHYAEFNHMIQHISDTMKFQESKRLAKFVQRSLYRNIRRFDRGTADHGIKPGPFVVLLGLKVPGILAELANLTSQTAEKRLKSSKYQDRIAKFLEIGIVNYLNNTTNLGEVGNGNKKEESGEEEE